MPNVSLLHPKLAILFFAQRASFEGLRKELLPTVKRNVALLQLLNERALKTIQKTGLPYFWIDETQQKGDTFGERIKNAVSNVFANGYEQVIIVGNDCAALSKSHFTKAATVLQTKNLVLGADQHGGAYLIGISKSSFNPENFAALSWQTDALYSEISQQDAELAELPKALDLNKIQDLFAMLRCQQICAAFKQSIRSLLFERTFVLRIKIGAIIPQSFGQLYNKGSPIAA